jgi:tripartite-type tricarboxylate transporter receptor subunit TctC
MLSNTFFKKTNREKPSREITFCAVFACIAGLVLFAAVPSLGLAQAFPTKPIKVVIGFPAGGPLDQHARLLSTKLTEILGQQIIIDYKAGAGGAIGAETVAKSQPDGYTILLANTGTMVINGALYPKLSYNTLKDFAPLARTAQQPLALLVHPSVPATNINEFVSYAKKNPGKLNYGSAGNGGISHLVPEMFKQASGVFMVHIPYRGSAPAFTDLIAGQVQFMAESIPQAAQYVKQGKVRAIAVTSAARNQALPDTPTAIEAGLKGFEVVGFYGFLAPAATPKDVVNKLSEAFQKALDSVEIRDRMISQGADPAFLNAEKFGDFLRAETPRWEKVVKSSGAKVD